MSIKRLRIITPVKDSLETALDTIDAILASDVEVPFSYTVYNDNSTAENTARLKEISAEKNFEVVNAADITSHPSPNYLLFLQMERRRCLEEEAMLIIIESDVTVKKDTIRRLWDFALAHPQSGIVASATVDANEVINYPYDFVKNKTDEVIDTSHHCSFCCSLLTPELFRKVDFDTFSDTKNWFDVTISHESLKAGLHNYVLKSATVLHRPHSSRPWKKLKYTNPLKYYFRKFTKGYDKI